MSKFYLFAIPQNAPLLGSTQKSASLVQEENQLLVRFSSAQKLEVGDKLLLVQPKGVDYDEVLPIIQKIALLDQQAGEMLLETDKVYDKIVSIDTVRSILNHPLSDHITPLTPVEFHSVVSEMGGVKLKESELLDYVKRYIAAKGYYFDDETIYNYHICLKTRPSLLKNTIVELCKQEKHRKLVPFDANSRQFSSKTGYFVFSKTHQFSFSTGSDLL